MDAISELENAMGAELLRAGLLGGARPKIAGRYIVERFLGRGATGLVVAALDDRLGRPVALKLGIAAADTTMLAEARALALLDHPNVVRVHDVDFGNAVFDGKPFRLWLVSMQRVEGRNLRVWLREQPRSQEEIVRVFVDAGRGLVAAHAAKIVHRDFKPDNVIVRNDGVAQVLDFGFAVPAISTHSDTHDAQPNTAGTEPYMAPEARLGRATRKSDQFSFGVALVEAFTGEPRPAGRGVPDGVPRALWTVLRRATSPVASRRFPEMSSLLEALSRRRPPSFWTPGGIGSALLMGVVMALLTRNHAALRGWAERIWHDERSEEVASSDAGAHADASVPSADVIAAAVDAGVDAPDVGPECATLSGTRTFYLASDGGPVPYGCYEVRFGDPIDGGVVAEVEKTGSGNQLPCPRRTGAPLVDRHVVFVPRSRQRVVARMELAPRDYKFSFSLSDCRLDGTFRTRIHGVTVDTGTISEVP